MNFSFLIPRSVVNTAAAFLIGLFGHGGLDGAMFAQDKPTDELAATNADRPYTISKETTYFTGPLKADGSIDFFAAINDHYSAGVTNENNAARFILPLLDPAEFAVVNSSRREQRLRALGLEPSEHPVEKAFQDVGPYFKVPAEQIQELDKQFSEAMIRPWTKQEFPRIAEWLADNDDALNRIAAGAKKERFFVPFIAEEESDAIFQVLLEHVQAHRYVVRALQVRANLQLGEQNWDEAWADILSIRDLGRLISQGPSLVEGLVSISITAAACDSAKRFIETAKRDSVDWPALQQSWNITPIARLGESLSTSERATIVQMICRFTDDSDQAADDFQTVRANSRSFGLIFENNLMSNKAFAGMLREMARSGEIQMDDTLRYVNGMYDRAIAISDMTNARERLDVLNQLSDEAREMARERERKPSLLDGFTTKADAPSIQFAKAMLSTYMPAVDNIYLAQWRTQGSMHVIELTLAARDLQARTGHWPESLRQLEPLVDRAAMEQPANGEPIGLRVEEGELVIYHWGMDQQDDSGDINQVDDKSGHRNSRNPPLDWGVRMRE